MVLPRNTMTQPGVMTALHTKRRSNSYMRFTEKNARDKYADEIALCMGFDSVFDLAGDVQDLLRTKSLYILDVVLQMVEVAAINCASYVQQTEDAEKLEAIKKMARAHIDSKTAKVRELMEEILVIIEEVEAIPTQEVYAAEYEYHKALAEDANVS
jgi:hypothetical protein